MRLVQRAGRMVNGKATTLRAQDVLLVSLLSLLSVTLWSAPALRIDVSKLGPQVGQRVPDFRLKDQNGKTQTLQSIMGSKGAMLVFIRSADW